MNGKLIVVSALALTLSVGGSAFLTGHANAAAANTDTKTQTSKTYGKLSFGQGKGGFRSESLKFDQPAIAEKLGLSETDLQTALEGGKSLAAIASEQGVDAQDIIDLITSQWTSGLSAQLSDGKITQEQYDKLTAALAEKVKDWVNQTFTGKEGKDGKDGKNGENGLKIGLVRGGLFQMDQSAIAEKLGLSEADLKTALEGSKSLAAIASEQGVEVQGIIDLITSEWTSGLSTQLSDGKITQDQYDKLTAALAERVQETVNRSFADKAGLDGNRRHPGNQKAAADSAAD